MTIILMHKDKVPSSEFAYSRRTSGAITKRRYFKVNFKLLNTALGILVWGFVMIIPPVVHAEYLLAAGDVIEFSAAGVPDLKHRSRVDASGEISLPLLGQLKAAGRPLSELRAEVRELLPTKSLRRKTSQGIDIVVVDPEEIALEIAEYRPVFINGDVAKPGEQPYRLGLTVRQVVALSGGYDLLRFRADQNPIMQSADLRSDYQNLWTEFAQTQAQVWRVEAELSDRASLLTSEEELRKLPIGHSVISSILRFEAERLNINRAVHERETMSLRRQIKQTDEQSALVADQMQKTKEGVELAAVELLRAQSLFERGLTPANRLAEERRLMLLTQTQHLQTTERQGQVKKDREELVRKLESFESQRRGELSREMQDSQMKLASVKTRLQAVDEKLTYAGILKSQLTRGKGALPELIIFRRAKAGPDRIRADEDTEVLPGDTIEVSLRSQLGLAAAERQPQTEAQLK
ncbi:polysaccharide biosynthesis/export family protein [Microvirga aerophila]|uniref:Exopolysaccharide biosynthesis protein n=1 Tax=Microvirga aerophila TaxID=670291 RepID=A0A512C2Z0_9HYPH|nr:polysaccharide biosynthesis/export family protein [Microvirga aerophila]GEO18583.1 exopolysaccharide biosynthesis protein [Microvirga aerophila]